MIINPYIFGQLIDQLLMTLNSQVFSDINANIIPASNFDELQIYLNNNVYE
jgi:hypothetical protein